jgi:SAM-dependent methyltransferase
MSSTHEIQRYTDPDWWDDYWRGIELPTEVRKSDNLLVREITDVFDAHLPPGQDRSAVELGGSSGRYLVYLYRRFGYRITVIENSRVGCEAGERNFALLGVPGEVVYGDMLDEALEVPQADVVYSLGLIEHFDDPRAVARAHLRLLKPGGTLVIGAPNLRGVNRLLFNRLSPSIFQSHHARSADPRSWEGFEREQGLERVFLAHIGGFEPMLFWRLESTRKRDWLIAITMKQLGRLFNHRAFGFLRRVNHPWWSAYVIAVYRAPG